MKHGPGTHLEAKMEWGFCKQRRLSERCSTYWREKRKGSIAAHHKMNKGHPSSEELYSERTQDHSVMVRL